MKFPWSKKPELKQDAVPEPKRKFRGDAFQNAATGIGTGSDKRTAGVANVVDLAQQDFEDLYRGDDMSAVVVEALPNEMLRAGFDVVIADEPELSEKVNKFLEDLDIGSRLREALYWSRQHGGAGILLGVDDGETDLSKPLDLDKIDSIKFFTTLNRWELNPQYYYGNPLAPKYGFPSVFYLQQLFGLPQEVADPAGNTITNLYTPVSNSQMGLSTTYPRASFEYTNKGISGAAVAGGKAQGSLSSQNPLRLMHESRFLLFDGVPVTRTQRIRNSGWGDSVYVRIFEVLRDYQLSWGGVTNLLSDFAQGVYKLQGLNEMILTGDPGDAISRIAQTDIMRSMARAIVLDAGGPDQKEETFERQVTTLSSLPEMLQQLSLRLAAAARMPVSLLLGQAPSGLNATGEADFRWYYDSIKAAQRSNLLPQLKKLLQVIFAAKDGPTGGKTPDNWSIQFRALWQLDDVQEAQRRLFVAQADQIYASTGILLPGEIAQSRFGGDEYEAETQLDQDARDKAAVNAATDADNHAAASNQKQGLNPDGSKPEPEAPTQPQQAGKPAKKGPSSPKK